MKNLKYKKNFHKTFISNSILCSKRELFCKYKWGKNGKSILKKDLPLSIKTSKINKLISNIYIYKFPPILKWPEGLFIGIPVKIVISIRKILEHSSGVVLNNIKELCFAFNVDSSSYGDKVIIFPIEYIIGEYSRSLFIDTFAHEVGHALLEEILKDNNTSKIIKSNHKIIKYYSLNYNKNLFFDIGNSEYSLANYQLEDFKEFFSELYSQILNYYEDLIQYTCSISFPEAQIAYLNSINLILDYINPLTKYERFELISI